MSIRSFAAGMIVGLVIPALILLALMMTNDLATASKVGSETAVATATANKANTPTQTIAGSLTAVPTQATSPTKAATATKPAAPQASPTGAKATPTVAQATKPAAPQATVTPVTTNDPSGYQVERVEVPAGRMVYLVFNLPENNTLEGYFEVTGDNGEIAFWATEQSGTSVIAKKDYSDRGEFSIGAKKGGQYTLFLDNSKSTKANRQVAVFYRLQPN